jgi:hypothetical protein
MELDVGVPSSSESKILESLDWVDILREGAVCHIDLGPEGPLTHVQAGLVSGNTLPAIFLLMVPNFAENRDLLVFVGVAALRVAPPV